MSRASRNQGFAALTLASVSRSSVKMPKGLKDVGTQLAKVIDTDIGRAILAEVLVQAATALSRNMPSAGEVQRAGARAGSAIADAGSSAADTGARAARSGARTASTAADTAKNLVKSVAEVAVGAVGDVMLDTAEKLLPGAKGSKSPSGQTPSTQNSSGQRLGGQSSSSQGPSGSASGTQSPSGQRPSGQSSISQSPGSPRPSGQPSTGQSPGSQGGQSPSSQSPNTREGSAGQSPRGEPYRSDSNQGGSGSARIEGGQRGQLGPRGQPSQGGQAGRDDDDDAETRTPSTGTGPVV